MSVPEPQNPCPTPQATDRDAPASPMPSVTDQEQGRKESGQSCRETFVELSPPYATIVVDPPWHYAKTNPDKSAEGYKGAAGLPYGSMSLDEIKALAVGDLTVDGRCFLWITNRYLRHGWDVLEAWGFDVQDRTLVWCKPPRATTPVTTEFVLMGRKGNPPRLPWHRTTWFQWPHTSHHSAKPDAFCDLVESWCPGPYVELFCRRPRLGWDSWGYGYEIGAAS